jgi:hypothetical protein
MSVESLPIIELPTDPDRLGKFKRAIENLDDILTLKDAQTEAFNEGITGVYEEFDISKKMIKRLANMRHKQNKDEILAETEQVSDAYAQLWD